MPESERASSVPKEHIGYSEVAGSDVYEEHYPSTTSFVVQSHPRYYLEVRSLEKDEPAIVRGFDVVTALCLRVN